MGRLNRVYQRWVTPPQPRLTGELQYWQERVLNGILLIAVLFGLPVYLASFLLSLKEGLLVVALADSLVYGILIFLALWRPGPYVLRAGTMVFLTYFLALILLYVLGEEGGGPVWLFSFPVMAGLLLGHSRSWMALGVNLITLIALGIILFIGYGTRAEGITFLIRWGVISLNFLLLNMMVTISLSSILRGMQTILESREEEQQKYQRIYENFLDIYFEIDTAGTILVITPSVQEIWRESPQELEGTCLYDRMEDEERDFFMGEILNDREVQNRETVFSTRAGWLACTVSARLNPAGPGGSASIFGVLRDITQWKEMEKEKRNLEDKLRQSEKMEALGLLAGGVAHDLNNILSGIVAYPDLIINELPPDSPLTPRLVAIKNSGEKAAAILEDLLNLARRNSITRQVINMEDLLRTFLKSPEVEALSRRYPAVKMETRLNAPQYHIEGSPFHLQKLILNLIVNGMEAQPRGGVLTLSLSSLPDYHGSTRYHEIPRGDYLLLRVEDQGAGIRPEDLDRIFEPFFTRKVMGRSGTGLGMAIVWGTIQDHGGFIDVRSIPERGTVVDIFLPLTTREVTRPFPIKGFSEYQGRGELILVVDDLLTQREINRHLLERLGYRTREFPSGEEVLEFLQENRADLVLLDMIMEGGMDGLETYRRIKKLKPDQKVIILSGYADSNRIEEARLLGIHTFLKKPCGLETLGTALHHALSD